MFTQRVYNNSFHTDYSDHKEELTEYIFDCGDNKIPVELRGWIKTVYLTGKIVIKDIGNGIPLIMTRNQGYVVKKMDIEELLVDLERQINLFYATGSLKYDISQKEFNEITL